MTRKPPGMPFETWVDRQIREAADRGAFDDLPGAGKPLPDRSADGEHWWIKGYLEREGLSGEAVLPPALQLRKEIERLPDVVARLRAERDVRDVVDRINVRVLECWRLPSGPGAVVLLVDADAVVERWWAARGGGGDGPREGTPTADAGRASPAADGTGRDRARRRPRWWPF